MEIFLTVLFVLGRFFLFFYIAWYKNRMGYLVFFLIPFVGLILILVLPGNYIECKNCGCSYSPRKKKCPVCGREITKE